MISSMRDKAGGPVSRRFFMYSGICYILFRVYLATLPGYVDDMVLYKSWAIDMARMGIGRAYDIPTMDYAPVLLYPLYTAGKIYESFDSRITKKDITDSPFLNFLVKIPGLISDILIGLMLYWLVSVRCTWGPARAGPGWGRLAALLYLWNPAVLWNSGYWGQTDSIHTLFAVAAVAASLGVSWHARSGAMISVSTLTKQIVAPLVPLLLLDAALKRGLKGFLRVSMGGIAAAVVLFLPFLFAGRMEQMIVRLVINIDVMPWTSANGHNLWWLVGPWKEANVPVLGFLTFKSMSLLLFAATFCLLVGRYYLLQRSGGDHGGSLRLVVFAAAIYSCLFFFSTHMHENHMFLVLPLLLVVAGRNRTFTWLAIGCSVAIFINTTLHDLELPYNLPLFLSAESPVIDRYFERPYTWLQLILSYANCGIVAAVTAGTFVSAWRGKSAISPSERGDRHGGRE